jgi:cell division protease FtsH
VLAVTEARDIGHWPGGSGRLKIDVLANTINEAVLVPARHGATQMGQKDLEEALEKVVARPERKSRRLSAEDKKRAAFHETGHALVGACSKHPEQLRKISIVPRGRAAFGRLPAI